MKSERDIVYILKNDIKPDELRYSLRSVCENFPHRNIVFVGGCPDMLSCDLHIPHKQVGATKWQKAMSSLKAIASDRRISEEFFLFNDDFFILSPIDTNNFINFSSGTLEKRIAELYNSFNKSSTYSIRLQDLKFTLDKLGKDSMSFALHLPFLLEKTKLQELFEKYPNTSMLRSFYGNYFNVPYTYHKDVKIYDNFKIPEFDDYCSTSDEAFKNGKVGKRLKKRFNTPCRYELDQPQNFEVKERYTEEGDDI